MKSSGFYAVLGAGVLIIIGIIWWGITYSHAKPSVVATSTASSVSSTPQVGDSIYTNGTYGFSIVYPGSATVQHTFDTTYHLPSTWRVDAVATGTPVVEINTYKTSSNTSYPHYFETAVRVGVSSDPKELAACTSAGDEETALPSRTINGITWHAFSYNDAGMMQYAQGTSYRMIRDGSCLALEAVEAGSSYIDTPSANDISNDMLQQHYKDLDAIVSSIAFARS